MRVFISHHPRQPMALLLLLLALTATATPAEAQTPRLRLASTPWSPFTNEPGEARFALDLVHAALERAGITAETTIVEENDLEPRLLAGDFDGSAALWRDPERESVLLYSQPYLENRLILVGRKGADVSAVGLTDLAGMRVALVEGYAYGDTVEDAAGVIFVPTLGPEDSLMKLLDLEADYTLMDELVVEYLIRNFEEQALARLEFGTRPLLARTLHLAVNRAIPDAESIIERFNAQLREMIADRSYHRLLHLEWIQADVDGDGLDEYVPIDDQAGPDPPIRAYALSIGEPVEERVATPRYFLGGTVYEGWSSVPPSYKVPRPGGTLNDGAAFNIFTFTW